jgi:fermentation-respiration switch protein FrsA (DUF1100 family)
MVNNSLLFLSNILLDASAFKIPLIILISIASLFLICFLLSALIVAKAFSRSKKVSTETLALYAKYRKTMLDGADFFLSLNPEKVTITSNDGLKLKAFYYKNPENKGTVIMMHGYHGKAINTFGTVAKIFINMGLSLLLPDQRAHGESEGKYLTLAARESEDCLLWTKYIANKFPNKPIALHGISMGGATVAIAGASNPPKEVKLIANDCGYTSADDIVTSIRKIIKLPKFPLHYFIRFWTKVIAKFSLTEKSVVESYKKITLPCLFIHGKADNFIPFSMGVTNYETCVSQHKLMIAIENAGHGLSYIEDPETVSKALIEFYTKHMLNE